MTFEEYLKTIEGLTDEQVSAIIGGMKENKLFISGEEKIDERYGKLKTQHDEVATKLTAAEELIKQLQPQAKGNEALQTKISDYEKQVKDAEERAAKAERDAAIKVALLANGAVPDDVDYLTYRIEQGDVEVKIGDDGKLSGIDDAVKGLKAAHPGQFHEQGGTGKFEGTRLPGSTGPDTAVTKEQFSKMGYRDRLKLFNDDPEAYNALSGND